MHCVVLYWFVFPGGGRGADQRVSRGEVDLPPSLPDQGRDRPGARVLQRMEEPVLKDANMYPWSIQSLWIFLGIHLSKLLTSLVQCIIKYS